MDFKYRFELYNLFLIKQIYTNNKIFVEKLL